MAWHGLAWLGMTKVTEVMDDSQPYLYGTHNYCTLCGEIQFLDLTVWGTYYYRCDFKNI